MAKIKWHFLGGVRTVTGSCHILEVDGDRILMDCGLFQGRRKEAEERNRNMPFDPGSIDHAIVGHAHIDHIGNTPTLVKNGYERTIYATHATRDLATLMLRDSAHIQEKDAEYVNKRERRRGKEMVQPLYDQEDVDATLASFQASGYHRTIALTRRVRATFYPAGHILGSALTLFEIDRNGSTTRVLYAVDLGRNQLPILKDPAQLSKIDVLILESTYGNREHEDISGAQDRLARVVNDTVQRGGKVIIPAFALGRTQEIVRSLAHLIEAGRIPKLPVYVDSPLAVNVTGVFTMHPEEFDRETNAELARGGDPFGMRIVKYITDVEESKALNESTDPCIIISASGMCEAGRILHHLRNNIGSEKNTIAIVGYQAQNTLGRRLAERRDEVRIFGEPFKRRAKVELLNAYSAHAGRSDLIRYVENTGKGPGQVYLVHGEPEQQEALHEELLSRGHSHVRCPETGEAVDIR